MVCLKLKNKVFTVFILFMFLNLLVMTDVYGQLSPDTMASTVVEPNQTLPGSGNVTVNFKDVDIRTVLHYLSEVSGVDIIPSPEVKGTVTMRLRDKPWESALNIVTRNYGYVYSHEGDIIRVIPKGQLNAEEPVTEVISLNHIIRNIDLIKEISGDSEGDVTIKETEENIQQVMTAVQSILDTKRGEKATYISSANAIVVNAIPARISKIKAMIERIDKKSPQILLDAKVIEITLDDDERFGIDWNAVISAAGAKRPITFPFTYDGLIPWLPGGQRKFYPINNNATGDFPSDFPTLSPTIFDPTQSTYSQDSLFTFGTIDASTFTATLSLLDNRGDTEILSSPRITTLDNQKATIKVIEKIMLQKTQETTQTAGIVTVEFEKEEDAREVGVKLTIMPHVNQNGDITVNLLPEVSTNAGFNRVTVGVNQTTTFSLTFTSREANTRVRVRDGETIFIGGLIRKRIDDTENKLPILGDIFGWIPLIGNVVKYEEQVIHKTEIVFFVTVHLLENGMESVEKSKSDKVYDRYFPDMEDENTAESGNVVKQGKMTVTEKEVELPKGRSEVDEMKKKHLSWFGFVEKDKEE